jgi:hypothetical protein
MKEDTDLLNIRHRRIQEGSAFLLANPSEPVRIVQENPCEPVITVFVYSRVCVTTSLGPECEGSPA